MNTTLAKKTLTLLSVTALGAGLLAGCSSNNDNSTDAADKSNIVSDFDLQAHRGGRGETTEESLKAFEKSLDLGVSTLELDIVLTKDNVPMVWHENEILAEKCDDTNPAVPDDPQYPYVGKHVKDLDWAQLQTLDCGKQLDKFTDAEVVKGSKLLQLDDVFALTKQRGADVGYNIETKLEPEEPDTAKSPQEFVDTIFASTEKAGVTDKVMIQSFDWQSLELVKQQHPSVPLVVLYDETTWTPGSAWTGSVDYDAVDGDIIKATQQLQAQVVSPGYAVPYDTAVGDDDYHPVATPEFVKSVHDAGLKIIPWTVNDKDTMQDQILAGVDGIITDFPTRLREVMESLDMPLPQAYPATED